MVVRFDTYPTVASTHIPPLPHRPFAAFHKRRTVSSDGQKTIGMGNNVAVLTYFLLALGPGKERRPVLDRKKVEPSQSGKMLLRRCRLAQNMFLFPARAPRARLFVHVCMCASDCCTTTSTGKSAAFKVRRGKAFLLRVPRRHRHSELVGTERKNIGKRL